jgi:hypothetical protein
MLLSILNITNPPHSCISVGPAARRLSDHVEIVSALGKPANMVLFRQGERALKRYVHCLSVRDQLADFNPCYFSSVPCSLN